MATTNEVTINSGQVISTKTISGSLSGSYKISGAISIPSHMEMSKYDGVYEFTPTFSEQDVPTANKYLTSDILIHSIQTFETSNDFGTTFII